MESGGVISDASWAVFDLSSQGEESDIMAQLLRSFPSHGEEDHQELPWCDQASNPYYFHCNPNSSSSSSLIVPSEYDGFYFGESNKALGISCYTAPLDLSMDQGQGAAQCLNVHGHGEVSCEDVGDSSVNLLDSFHTTNKRKRPDGRTRGQKCTRKADSKRMKKLMRSENGDDTSENDSNASQESPADATPNGKAHAGRRSTTDPHSLYARKRRERINERLRILQNLVPNGTKVDISTMLEEAVHYVKFLQLQIKLLSSDEMWMYAPIAYNGMSIGIDLNIPEH